MIQHQRAPLLTDYVVGGTTDSTTETTFHDETDGTTTSGGYLLQPAGSVRKGDYWLCTAVVDCPTTNSTDTLTLKAYYGPTSSPKTGILVCDQTAIDVANDAEIALFFWVSCDVVGAASTAKFSAGGLSWADAATAVSKTNAKSTTDAQVSTVADMVIALTATWSASSASNQAQLRSFHAIKFSSNPTIGQ